MREPYERDIKKEMLDSCFHYLVDKGLENASIKNLCEVTGISSGSIYYWFKDKNEVVLDSTTYGLNEVTEELFNYAFEHTENLDELCKGLVDISKDKKAELRLIFQIASSQQYEEHLKEHANKLQNLYQKYNMILSKKLEIDCDTLFPFVNLFIAAIIQGALWDNWERLNLEMKCIISSIMKCK